MSAHSEVALQLGLQGRCGGGWLLLALLLAVGLTAGCGASDSTIHLTGAITYDGRPIPAGLIQFSPDDAQGNSGYGCVAIIRNGHYTTRESLGVIGGEYVIRVQGFDGIVVDDDSNGSPMFRPYQMKVELPLESGEFDIDVPVETKKKRR